MGLYHKYRPKTWKEVLGQPQAVQMLQEKVSQRDVPHTIMLTGPSGCGKTTIARILKNVLGCGDLDFAEVNCGSVEKPIDKVREIEQRVSLCPISGDCRIWYLDEVQALSRAKFAQEALLKLLEDTPKHVYFILATTEPKKLLRTIRTRCFTVELKTLSKKHLGQLLDHVLEQEKQEISDKVKEQIIETVEGSARLALIHLEKVLTFDKEEDQLAVTISSDTKKQAIDIARALIKPTSKWAQVAQLLKEVNEEPESLRHMILSYAEKVLLGGGELAGRAFLLIDVFRNPFYDSRRPGLVAACYEVYKHKE